MKVSGAHLAVRALENVGVRFTFGVPGVHNTELYDELHRLARREVYRRDGALASVQIDTDGDGERDLQRYVRADGSVVKEGRDRDGDGTHDEWRYPVPGGGVRVGHDDDADHEIDHWDPPGPPPGWCAARCVVR